MSGMNYVWARRGFTIVELTIVISVIGILAAITTVSYNGSQNRAHDNSVNEDLKKLQNELSIYESDNGSYPTTANFTTAVTGVKVTKGSYVTNVSAMLYCVSTAGDTVAIIGRSKSDKVFYFLNDGKVTGYPTATAFPGTASTNCQAVTGNSTDNTLWINNGGGTNGTWSSNV